MENRMICGEQFTFNLIVKSQRDFCPCCIRRIEKQISEFHDLVLLIIKVSVALPNDIP